MANGYDDFYAPEETYAQNDAEEEEKRRQLFRQEGIASAYQKYLGRAAGQDEIDFHARTSPDNFDSVIQNSAEAQAWASKPATGSAQGVPGTNPSAPAGSVAPTNTYDRAALSQAIQQLQFGGGSTDLNTQYNPAQFIQQNQSGFAAGVTMVGTDKIRLPDGEIVDIGKNIGANGSGGAWWGSEKDWAASHPGGNSGSVSPVAAPVPPAPVASPFSPAPVFEPANGSANTPTIPVPDKMTVDPVVDKVPGGPAAAPAAAEQDAIRKQMEARMAAQSGPLAPVSDPQAAQAAIEQKANQDALYQQLLARAQQGVGVDAQTDRNIRQQADPYEAAMIRAERERFSNEAESQGGLANLTAERRLGAERVGQAAGAFEARLIGDEMQNKRTEIQNALSQMGDQLNENQRSALTKELAVMDDQLKRYQSSVQQGQFDQGLGFEKEKFQVSNSQFAQSFGLDEKKLNSANAQWAAALGLDQKKLDSANTQFAAMLAFDKDKLGVAVSQFAAQHGLDASKVASANDQWRASLGMDEANMNSANDRFAAELAQRQNEQAQQQDLYNRGILGN